MAVPRESCQVASQLRARLRQVPPGVAGERRGGRLVEMTRQEDPDGPQEKHERHDDKTHSVDHPGDQEPLLVLLQGQGRGRGGIRGSIVAAPCIADVSSQRREDGVRMVEHAYLHSGNRCSAWRSQQCACRRPHTAGGVGRPVPGWHPAAQPTPRPDLCLSGQRS